MATIKQLRDAIATAVDGITGLRATGLVLDQINPPLAEVARIPWSYDDVQHGPGAAGSSTLRFRIRVYVQRTSERSGQDLLDDYAEPSGVKSIKAAVETNVALDALCDYVLVTEVSEVLPITHESGVVYLVEDFAVEVAI